MKYLEINSICHDRSEVTAHIDFSGEILVSPMWFRPLLARCAPERWSNPAIQVEGQTGRKTKSTYWWHTDNRSQQFQTQNQRVPVQCQSFAPSAPNIRWCSSPATEQSRHTINLPNTSLSRHAFSRIGCSPGQQDSRKASVHVWRQWWRNAMVNLWSICVICDPNLDMLVTWYSHGKSMVQSNGPRYGPSAPDDFDCSHCPHVVSPRGVHTAGSHPMTRHGPCLVQGRLDAWWSLQGASRICAEYI